MCKVVALARLLSFFRMENKTFCMSEPSFDEHGCIMRTHTLALAYDARACLVSPIVSRAFIRVATTDLVLAFCAILSLM